ncbi:DUF4362 domain-containing protein [Solibacillus sp. FSL W7-1324]|uniref:DUF4362 domain-containing protein n=1 Tax=Solibacillus sp. FSL W7-1324 TaxID=2921701 RepID=UPI0030FC918F
MKNLLALGILLLLAGCQENVQPETIEQTEVETVRNDRVIDHNGEIENLELLHQFLKDTEDNKQSSLELTRYTIEGAPIYWRVEYQEGQYNIEVDNREDNFGSQNIENYQCGELNEDVTGSLTDYNFKSCEGGYEINLLSVTSD